MEAERIKLFDWVSENHGDLNVLVNNAGIQNWMNITDVDFYKRSNDEITTNIIVPVHLTSLFANLKSLKTIINVTSGLAFVSFSKVPVYCATKSFLHSFTLSTRHLLKAKNIEVIEMIPPALNTDLGGKGLHDTQPPVSDFIHAIFEQLKEGKTELSYGFSEAMVKANAEEIRTAFNRLNPVNNPQPSHLYGDQMHPNIHAVLYRIECIDNPQNFPAFRPPLYGPSAITRVLFFLKIRIQDK